MKLVTKALVGSRAHGLYDENSDYDWRGVYLEPTSKLLSLNHKYKGTHWLEGNQDETSYELGHFLQLATKGNPSILELLVADNTPVQTELGLELRKLMPMMYTPKDVFNAFSGYSHNQRKKLLDDHLNRRNKFAVAYVRTAYSLYELFSTGTFSLYVHDTQLREYLMDLKYDRVKFTNGQVVDKADFYLRESELLLHNVENKQDLDKVNDFLLNTRLGYLTE